jgi:curved DNA-binding protein CbpA
MIERFLPYTPDRDVYRLLQVDPRAGTEEILDAWRRLARTFHPDRNGSGRANEEMQVVNALRDLLTDPTTRAAYDRERQRWMSTVNGQPTARTDGWFGAPPPAPPVDRVPGSRPAPSPSPLGRTARALAVGVRAFALALLPARCQRCGGAVGRSDPRCWICGFPTNAPRLP